jgi:D-alanyl-D-alanine endopeptidase (penicillin-binding protein 7)
MRNLLISICIALAATSAVAKPHKKLKRVVTPPAFTSESILIADLEGHIVREHDGELVRPIASISKLMVALLASEQALDEQLEIPRERTVMSSIPRSVTSMTRNELLTLALVRSDNFAAQILCNNIENCVEKMNARAVELGMANTHYNEPTGLDKGNVSTAVDLLKLMIVASQNETITSISRMPTAEITLAKQSIKIKNTNPLTSKLDVVLSKTGFTNPAGGCLVMIVNSPVGQRVLILLGSKNAHTRIPAMEKLYKEM